ncbi:MAG TPA: hypothetical protein VKE96_20995 [Vicinamibacterales bacterium]|nr:hypothetical protein [Vicinamibacterales bacterium]
MSTTTARRVQVETLSARAELLAVVRASMGITIGVWIYAAMMAGVGGNAPRQRNLLPFQKLIADRVPTEQRMFRELQEGLLEAEAARSTASAWPTPDSLAAAGVPPFAHDPTQRSSFVWRLVQSGTMVNYIGIPTTAGLPAWLLLVTEPTPGVPPDQTFEDEEHHRLQDGGMLHVSTWVHGDGRGIAPRLVRMPQAEGWTQLYAVGPAQAAARR